MKYKQIYIEALGKVISNDIIGYRNITDINIDPFFGYLNIRYYMTTKSKLQQVIVDYNYNNSFKKIFTSNNIALNKTIALLLSSNEKYKIMLGLNLLVNKK